MNSAHQTSAQKKAVVDRPVRFDVLGVGISSIELDQGASLVTQAAKQPGFLDYVTVTGVHGVIESQDDEELLKIHNESFMSTPDGMPMVWVGKWSGNSGVDRVYGPDLMHKVLNEGRRQNLTHYLFGGAKGVPEQLKDSVTQKYPKVEVVGLDSPPFRALNDEEYEELRKDLDSKRPHCLWIGLSTPKQERLMAELKKRFAGLTDDWDHGLVMLGVGAAFDFLSDRKIQAPRWIQRSGFEWLFRAVMEPRRLAARYAKSNTRFIGGILKQMTR